MSEIQNRKVAYQALDWNVQKEETPPVFRGYITGRTKGAILGWFYTDRDQFVVIRGVNSTVLT